MTAQTNLTAVVAKQKADQAAKEKAEEKKALKAEAEEKEDGKILVRLIRDAYTKQGIILKAGLHRLPEDEIPSSAKRIEE